MGTISEKLSYLEETKENIKQALINKGQAVSESDTFRSYADKIQNIQGESEPPVLMDKKVVENGVYDVRSDPDKWIGIEWWGDSKQGYSKPDEIIGDYIWINIESVDKLSTRDKCYNGKLKDGRVVPDKNAYLGRVKTIEKRKEIRSSDSANVNLVYEKEETDFWMDDGRRYFCRINSTRSWVEGVYNSVDVGSQIYASREDRDSPDLNNPLDQITRCEIDNLIHFDFVTGYGFGSSGTITKVVQSDGYSLIISAVSAPHNRDLIVDKNGIYDIEEYSEEWVPFWIGSSGATCVFVRKNAQPGDLVYHAKIDKNGIYGTFDGGDSYYRYAPDFNNVFTTVVEAHENGKISFKGDQWNIYGGPMEADHYITTGFGKVEVNVSGGQDVSLRQKTINENGTYIAKNEPLKFAAFEWSDYLRNQYTGETPLVGDYSWMICNSYNAFSTDLKVGDYAYTSKIVDGQEVPDLSAPIGRLQTIKPKWHLNLSCAAPNWGFLCENTRKFNRWGTDYYALWANKESIPECRDRQYVWVQGPFELIGVGSRIYDNVDQEGVFEPDFDVELGTVTQADWEPLCTFDFLDSGQGWTTSGYPKQYPQTFNFDGYSQVIVDVKNTNMTIEEDGVYTTSAEDLAFYPVANKLFWKQGKTLALGDKCYASKSDENGNLMPDVDNVLGTITNLNLVPDNGYFLVDFREGSYKIVETNKYDLYKGLNEITVNAGKNAENRLAEELMLVNDGEVTLNVEVVTSSTYNFTLTLESKTNNTSVPAFDEGAKTASFKISADPSKKYILSVLEYKDFANIKTFEISGGTTSYQVNYNN